MLLLILIICLLMDFTKPLLEPDSREKSSFLILTVHGSFVNTTMESQFRACTLVYENPKNIFECKCFFDISESYVHIALDVRYDK